MLLIRHLSRLFLSIKTLILSNINYYPSLKILIFELIILINKDLGCSGEDLFVNIENPLSSRLTSEVIE